MKNKILIIDNDVVYVTATALFFEQNGYDVICAHSGQEGFQKVKTESPDLIFLELMMSYETEGAEIAKALAQDAATKDIPIILVTAARKEMGFPFELKPDKDLLPVKAVVEKPIEPETLLKMAKGYITRNIEMHRKIIGELDALARKWKDKKGNLVMILHEIQNHYGRKAPHFRLSRNCLLS
ncbi:MAG: response regulator [Candidatus Omnitrophica bacterium]|nr:response regulator [Candidatus Omnitrophota bacterium]